MAPKEIDLALEELNKSAQATLKLAICAEEAGRAHESRMLYLSAVHQGLLIRLLKETCIRKFHGAGDTEKHDS